ncbi:flavin reductase family protein [Dactylosporangium sp. CA-139066]|uniref:flavin reductase family protein n=1 Tax=Dactylosporangium sp. CA-139066 TaxID=3239930 RepID=UPI003D8F7558
MLDVTVEAPLRAVLGTFATGVTVVTVGDPVPHGMTANSFTSVSLDPPLVLVCVNRGSVMQRRLERADCFAVSVLDAAQRDVAARFADRSRPGGAAQFDGVACEPGAHTGAPLIAGALAWLECRRWRTYDGGDHWIHVGRVLSVRRAAHGDALMFFEGHYLDGGHHDADRS